MYGGGLIRLLDSILMIFMRTYDRCRGGLLGQCSV